MEFYEKDFGKILKANALKQKRLMLQYGTDCMRVYDRNLEQYPVTIDLYGRYARITDYSVDGMDDAARENCCDIAGRMLYVEKDHVVFFHRKKREGREQHGLQSEESVKTQVKENGLLFTVDLTRHIDTGLFLDHSVTRQWVREQAAGLDVLNLFSYTGAFSVYAASGGAKRVVSVDLSKPYSQWARENLKANGFEGDAYPCVEMDAKKFVREQLLSGTKYDLVIFDPPTFSNSHKMDHDFDVQRDYQEWLWMLNGLLTMGGRLLFSTNLERFRLDERGVYGYDIEEVSKEVAAPGFTKRTGTSRTWLLTKVREEGPRERDMAGWKEADAEARQEETHMDEEVKKDQEVQETAVEETEKKPAKKTTRKTTTKKAAAGTKKTTRKSTKKAAAEEVKAEEAPKAEEAVVEEAPKAEEVKAEEVKAEEAVVEEAPKAEKAAPSEEEKAEEPAPEAEEKAEEAAPEQEKSDDDMLTLDWSDEEPETDKDAPTEDAASEEEEAEESDEDQEEEEGEPEEEDPMAVAAKAFQPRPYTGYAGRKQDSDEDDEDDDRRDEGRGYGRDRDDRGYGRRSYGDRDDRRGGYGRGRDDRGYGRRDDRGFGGRRYDDDRRGGFGGRDRDDRGYGRRSFDDRDDRGFGGRRYDDDRRGGFGGRDRDDRGYGRRSYGDRDDRGYGERRSYGDRGFDRDDRGYGRRDDRRGGFGGRDRDFGGRGFSRPDRYNDRDDRGSRRPKPYGMDKFRPSNGREGEGKSFFWLEKDKKNDRDDD